MANVYIITGYPGAGKTTLVNTVAAAHPDALAVHGDTCIGKPVTNPDGKAVVLYECSFVPQAVLDSLKALGTVHLLRLNTDIEVAGARWQTGRPGMALPSLWRDNYARLNASVDALAAANGLTVENITDSWELPG